MREHHGPEAGLNVFEFIGLLMLSAGLVLGIYAAADQGLWAAIKGGLLGLGKAFLIYVIFMLCIMIPLSLGLRYRPQFPRCRKGKCKDQDYRFVYANIVPPEVGEAGADATADERDLELYKQHKGLLVRCACGDLYLRSERDRKFYEVREDRSLAPFMKHRFAGRWQQDGM